MELFTKWRDRLIERFRDFDDDPEKIPWAITHYFRHAAIAMKHNGFREEQEWRLVYRPAESDETLVNPAVRSHGGSVQTVYEMPLEVPDDQAASPPGYSLDTLVDRLIIGPSDHPLHSMRAFSRALTDAGVSDAAMRVKMSTIPLR